jgi:hypothetical protein
MSFPESMPFFDDALLRKLFEDSLLRFYAFDLTVVHDRLAVDAFVDADGFQPGICRATDAAVTLYSNPGTTLVCYQSVSGI